jgi:hypothetical protein
MHRTKIKILTVLLILTSLVLAACGSAPEAIETEPEAEIGLDGDWMVDDTPPYPYAQAMRDQLDPVLQQAFGIEVVHYYVFDLMGTYNVRFALQDVPEGEAFYYTLEDVFNQAFDFYIFADMESAESYFQWYDELPEEMSVAMDFEDTTHYWLVTYDGTYLTFTTL